MTALAQQVDPPPYEVIVVDDGSNDDTRAVATADARVPVRVLETLGGEGPGKARNIGAQAASGELLVFRLPLKTIQNRPLDLHIDQGGKSATVTLDL